MFEIARTTLAALVILHGVAVTDESPNAVVPLVSIGEGAVDLGVNGITANSCIVIREDGTFHLERRLQILPAGEATLHIYEATFNAFEMDRLRYILDAHELRELHDYRPPQFPVAVSTINVVQAKIMRFERAQSIGYFTWNSQPGRADSSPESTPEELKREWSSSRVAMSPLVGWLHEIEGRTWPEVDESHSNLCEAAATSVN